MRDQLRQPSQPLVARLARIDRTQLRKHELGLCGSPGRLVATKDFERLFGDDRRQAVGVVELPIVDETIVARAHFMLIPRNTCEMFWAN